VFEVLNPCTITSCIIFDAHHPTSLANHPFVGLIVRLRVIDLPGVLDERVGGGLSAIRVGMLSASYLPGMFRDVLVLFSTLQYIPNLLNKKKGHA